MPQLRNEYRTGVWLIERLSAASLAACATATKRTVAQFLQDNGYLGVRGKRSE